MLLWRFSHVLVPLVSIVSLDPLHRFSMLHAFRSFYAFQAHPLTTYWEHVAGAMLSHDLS